MNCNYLIKTGFVLFTLLSVNIYAQNVGINSKGNKPSSDAVLDLRTGNLGSALGFLPNEVSLLATNSASPFSTPDTGLIVYNYKTAGTVPYNVVPGYYYWTGSAWVMMLAPSSGTVGQVLTSNGGGAPSWTTLTSIVYSAGTGIKISNDTISSTQSTGAINYVGDSYLGITSGAGSTGTSEGTSSNLVNINIGQNAGNANTTGNNNFFLGNQAGYDNTSGSNNIAIGTQTLQFEDQISNLIAIGTNALANSNYYSYALNTGGDIAIGINALAGAGSNANTAVGYEAGHNFGSSDAYNTLVGYEAMGSSNVGGNYNSGFGYRALYNSLGNSNSAFGYNSGLTNVAGSSNTFLGYQADASSAGLTNATAIGANAKVSSSNTILLGSNSVTATEFNGALMPYYSSAYQAGNSGQILESQGSGVAPQWVSASSGLGAIRYVGTSYLGITSGAGSTGTSEGTSSNLVNINIGQNAGNSNTTGSNNFFLGNQAGYNNTTGSNNVAIGTQALQTNDQIQDVVAIGTNALSSVSYSPYALNSGGDIAIGVNALAGANSNKNTAVGFAAGHYFGNTDSNNTLIGYEVQGGTVVAGINNSGLGYHSLFNSTGSRNSAFGSSSGFSNVAGSNNTFLGYKADAASSGLTNATAIGANATVSTNNSLILGSGANVGIGTSSPTSILHTIASGAKTTAYSGNLLTNTATSSTSSITKAGVEIQSTGSWTGSSANNIGLYVSSVTGGTANYDAIFNGGGNVGIGTTSPSSPLEVVGTAQYISQFQSSNTTGTWMVLNNTTTGAIPWNFVSTGSANGEGAGNLLIRDNSNVRMIMQSSTGNIGIGTTSPTAILHTVASGAKTANYSGNLLTNTATSSTASIKKAALELQSTGSWTGTSANNIGLYVSSTTGGTNNYDAIFNGGGNVGIGTSSPTTLFYVTGTTGSGGYIATVANTTNASNAPSNGINILAGANSYTSGSTNFVSCKTPNGTQIGSINQSSTTSVSFNTTSDERLKENIIPTKYGINDLIKIQIRDYNYIGDNSKLEQTGYLAQQLYTVFPNAVHVGGNDAKTDPWMVDYGRITPLIVKSIQDQQQIIDEQNKKLDAQQKEIDELKQMVQQMANTKK